ncbi:hypothetical protein [Micromonospora sp. NPDC049374]|uniref:hypothetical protein n=1 Tax=Micromonospora sp. NPDC049374 TaxID=3154352 RepID=UPI003420F7FE
MAITEAATTLASMFDITWRVADNEPGHNMVTLAGRLVEARRDGSTFLMPEQARGWFDLSFDIPDTAYALALVLVWSFAAAGTPAGGAATGNRVPIAMWHLRHLLPRSAHRALADIEDAFAQFDPPAHTNAAVR